MSAAHATKRRIAIQGEQVSLCMVRATIDITDDQFKNSFSELCYVHGATILKKRSELIQIHLPFVLLL